MANINLLTYSADGTMTIPYNLTMQATGMEDLLSKLLNENDIKSVTITTTKGDSLVLNHYDDIKVEYNQQNIEEID